MASEEVPRTTTITAVFDARLAASAADAGNVVLTSALGMPLPASVAINGDSLVLTPASVLPGDTSYLLLLNTGVSDIAGRKLAAPVLTQFTTAAQAWDASASTVGVLPKDINPYMTPSTVVDRAGNVTASWQPTVPSSAIHTARLDASTGVWSAARVLYQASATFVEKGPLVTAPNGDVDQFWFEDVQVGASFQRHVRQSHFDHAAYVWGAAKTVRILPEGHLIDKIEVVSDAEGRLTALMSNSSIAGESGLYAARRDQAGGTWSAPVRVDGPGQLSGNVNRIAVATDGAGNVTALWERGANGLVTARYDIAAGRWSAPSQLTEASNAVLRAAALSVNPRGFAVAAWSEPDTTGTSSMVKAARFDPASLSWSSPARLNKAGANAGSPMAVIDTVGNVMATWRQDDGVYAARYDTGAMRWGSSQGLSTGPYLFVGERAMAVDVAGNVTLLVTEDQVVKALRYRSASRIWGSKTRLAVFEGSTEKSRHEPSLVIDQAGNATALWFTRRDQGAVYNHEVVANRFR